MTTRFAGPLALCRVDRELQDRVTQRRMLGALLAESLCWMLVGAAIYGFVFGMWRSELQGLYAAIKLPTLLATIVLSTAFANAVFAHVLGTRLGALQILVCSTISMADLAIILASVAPISALFALSVANYGDDSISRLGPAYALARADAQALLGLHVLVIGAGGLLAISRMRRLLLALISSRRQATQLFILSLIVQALAGMQTSWILRPYLGKPWLAVEFLREDAFSGSFFEEVASWLVRV